MSLAYILTSMKRTPYQSASAILIMVITFFVMTIFLFMGLLTQGALLYFESKPQISVFYPNEMDVDQILTIKQELERTGKTKEVTYISSKEAVEIFKARNEGEDIAADTDFINENVLPPSLEIKARSLSDLKQLKEIVEKTENAKVVFLEDVVEQLGNWLNGIRTTGLIILSLLALESVLVIWTIIGLRITQRKEEIEILELLGASQGFIKKPFLIEGMIYGFLGALIGTAAMLGVLQINKANLLSFFAGEAIEPLSAQNTLALFPTPATQQYFSELNGIPLDPVTPDFYLLTLVLMVLLGSILGAVGAYVAAQRCKVRIT